MSVETVVGKSATIEFDGQLCIHARRCVLSQPTVFKANVEGPWIDPDAASAEALMYVALNCPSGAIRVSRGGANETNPKVNTISVRENGPLAISAEIVLAGAPIGMRATLCRCGESKNKPYCDGSHVAAAFAATGEPNTATSVALAKRDGPLTITPYPNGPLGVAGASRDHFWNGTHRQSCREDRALPMRSFGQQALLRRRARQSRVRRAIGC